MRTLDVPHYTRAELESGPYPQPGNWMKFDSFAWHNQPVDADAWCIVYAHNRDSTLIDQSNAAVIDAAMSRYVSRGTAREETHNHWACGWIDGYAIRCYTRNGKPTRAYATYCALLDRMADYPLLNEDDYSQREYDAATDWIDQQIGYLSRQHDITVPSSIDGSTVYRWLSDNGYDSELDNTDDNGASPSDDSILAALHDLVGAA